MSTSRNFINCRSNAWWTHQIGPATLKPIAAKISVNINKHRVMEY